MIDLAKAKLVALGVIVLLLAGWAFTAHERSVGALDAKIATLEAQTKTLSHTADSLENLFRVDTVTLVRRIVQVVPKLDTIIQTAIQEHHDTVTVERTVLVQADSTIKACRVVMSECAAGWTTEKGINASLRAELTATQAKVPSTFGNVLRGILTFAAGYGTHAAIHR